MSTEGIDLLRDNPRTYGRTASRTPPEPSLFLDFARATALDPRITFTRGSQATLFDSTGTLKYAKHNLLLRSQEFDDAAWTVKGNISITQNSAVAPDGTTTADLIIANTVSGQHRVAQTIATTAQQYTLSVYAKAGGYNWVVLYANAGNTGRHFDVQNGVVGQQTGNANTAAITAVGNGWYRCSITYTATAASDLIIFNVANADGTFSFVGNNTSGVYLWGCQLEIGATANTYIATTSAAYYAPRFDYNPSTLQPRGLLIEEQRTNSIRNNTMQGAVAGTPGTYPTNWNQFLGADLTSQIIGSGAESGITYLDVKITGTVSAARIFAVYFDTSTGIAATNGQTWALSSYSKIAAGSSSNISTVRLGFDMHDSGGAFLGSLLGSGLTVTSSALSGQRYSSALTTTNASTAFIRPYIRIDTAASGAVDITLRIGLPQLELGAFATSVIPTTTTALTRNADVASMTGTNFSSWYSATEGTLFAEFTASANANTVYAAISNGATNQNSIYFDNDSGVIRNVIFSSNSAQAAMSTGAIGTVGTVNKIAGAYKVNDFAVSRNGAAAVTDTAGNVPVSPSQLNIGRNPNAVATTYVSGYIRRLAFYPQRLPNATLQALTA